MMRAPAMRSATALGLAVKPSKKGGLAM